jgi:hypothetical protein
VLTLSKSTLARNPNLRGGSGSQQCQGQRVPGKETPADLAESSALAARSPRIRQSSKPLSNKLEAEFGKILRSTRPYAVVWEKGLCFRLANGCVYWPDWVVFGGSGVECHEVKGKKAWDDAIVKLKVAARTYPQLSWFLQDKPDGQWREYRVLP